VANRHSNTMTPIAKAISPVTMAYGSCQSNRPYISLMKGKGKARWLRLKPASLANARVGRSERVHILMCDLA
jgi:hypothetical protein